MSSEEREGTLKGTQASRLNFLNGKVMWFFLPQGRSQNVGHPSLGSIPCSFSALFPRSWAQGQPASKQRKNKHISKNPSLGVGKHEGMSGRKKAKRQRGQWFIFLLLLRVCCGEITKGFTFLEEKQNADIEGYCMEGMSVSWKACETTQEERGLYLGESLYFLLC